MCQCAGQFELHQGTTTRQQPWDFHSTWIFREIRNDSIEIVLFKQAGVASFWTLKATWHLGLLGNIKHIKSCSECLHPYPHQSQSKPDINYIHEYIFFPFSRSHGSRVAAHTTSLELASLTAWVISRPSLLCRFCFHHPYANSTLLQTPSSISARLNNSPRAA